MPTTAAHVFALARPRAPESRWAQFLPRYVVESANALAASSTSSVSASAGLVSRLPPLRRPLIAFLVSWPMAAHRSGAYVVSTMVIGAMIYVYYSLVDRPEGTVTFALLVVGLVLFGAALYGLSIKVKPATGPARVTPAVVSLAQAMAAMAAADGEGHRQRRRSSHHAMPPVTRRKRLWATVLASHGSHSRRDRAAAAAAGTAEHKAGLASYSLGSSSSSSSLAASSMAAPVEGEEKVSSSRQPPPRWSQAPSQTPSSSASSVPSDWFSYASSSLSLSAEMDDDADGSSLSMSMSLSLSLSLSSSCHDGDVGDAEEDSLIFTDEQLHEPSSVPRWSLRSEPPRNRLRTMTDDSVGNDHSPPPSSSSSSSSSASSASSSLALPSSARSMSPSLSSSLWPTDSHRSGDIPSDDDDVDDDDFNSDSRDNSVDISDDIDDDVIATAAT